MFTPNTCRNYSEMLLTQVFNIHCWIMKYFLKIQLSILYWCRPMTRHESVFLQFPAGPNVSPFHIGYLIPVVHDYVMLFSFVHVVKCNDSWWSYSPMPFFTWMFWSNLFVHCSLSQTRDQSERRMYHYFCPSCSIGRCRGSSKKVDVIRATVMLAHMTVSVVYPGIMWDKDLNLGVGPSAGILQPSLSEAFVSFLITEYPNREHIQMLRLRCGQVPYQNQ